MWAVGLNKSKVSVGSRESSVESGENRTGKSLHRVRNKRLCEGQPQEIKSKLRRTLSKSSLQQSTRQANKKESNISRSRQCSEKGEDANPLGDSLVKTQVKIANNIKDCQSEMEQETVDKRITQNMFDFGNIAAERNLLNMKQNKIKTSIGIQTDSIELKQNQNQIQQSRVQERNKQLESKMQKQYIQSLLSKIQKIERVNNLYQLKITEITIDYANFKLSVSKQIMKVKEDIDLIINRVLHTLRLKQIQSDYSLEFQNKQRKDQYDQQQKSCGPQYYVNNILKNVSELRSTFNAKSKNHSKILILHTQQYSDFRINKAKEKI